MGTQEKNLFIGIIISMLVVGAVLLFFTISLIRQQRRTLLLQKQNALAEISAMEKERARIANDLHDDVGPVLSVIKFQIDGVEAGTEEDQEELDKATEQIDGLMKKLREISANLMPSSLLRKGLVAASAEFLEKVQKTGIFDVSFTNNLETEVSQEQRINTFRILQEVVHNAIKHSKASRLEVDLSEKEGRLQLLIRDNGKGFDYNLLKNESAGFGLRSLKSRAELMGGTLRVETKESVGSAFLFDIPLIPA